MEVGREHHTVSRLHRLFVLSEAFKPKVFRISVENLAGYNVYFLVVVLIFRLVLSHGLLFLSALELHIDCVVLYRSGANLERK